MNRHFVFTDKGGYFYADLLKLFTKIRQNEPTGHISHFLGIILFQSWSALAIKTKHKINFFQILYQEFRKTLNQIEIALLNYCIRHNFKQSEHILAFQ